jgi:hypothetical protein
MSSVIGTPADVPNSYEEALSQIPVPAWDQSERFALLMSVAHSWYKFWPDQEHEFFLFLDPATETNEGYSRNFRQQRDTSFFGHWNYHRPTFFTHFPEVWLPSGTKVSVPATWAQHGRVLLNPFIHTVTPFGYLNYERFSTEKWPAESFEERIGMCLEERMAHRPRRLKEAFEELIPESSRIASKPVPPSLMGYEWYCFDARWKEKLQELRIPKEHWSPLCKYFVLLRHEQRVRDFFPCLSPRYSVEFYATALAEERVLQLTSLTDAMHRFLSNVKQGEEAL